MTFRSPHRATYSKQLFKEKFWIPKRKMQKCGLFFVKIVFFLIPALRKNQRLTTFFSTVEGALTKSEGNYYKLKNNLQSLPPDHFGP